MCVCVCVMSDREVTRWQRHSTQHNYKFFQYYEEPKIH